MKRLLLLSEVFPPKVGGSGQWLWEVYRRLPREQVFVVAGETPGQYEFDQTHDLNLQRLPLSFPTWGLLSRRGLWHYWRTWQRLARMVREHWIQVLHCARCLPEGLLAWLLRWRYGTPYGCYVHGEELKYALDSHELWFLARRVLGDAAWIIANSGNTCRMLVTDWGLPAHRIHLVHPGVDTVFFLPAERDVAKRRELGWGERPVVLTVSRLQKRKGHDQMIRALAQVRRDVPDVLYAIVGDGEERGTLEKLVVEVGVQGHVQFHGGMSNEAIRQCYQQCDLFVLPNRQVGQDVEGFGMVLLEAQACGKPVIAGASGGTAETMQVPHTGLVIPCQRPDLVAHEVSVLLQDNERRQRMGQAARSWVVEHFDWTTQSRKAHQVFDRHASSPRTDRQRTERR